MVCCSVIGEIRNELFVHNNILKYTLQIYENIINYALEYCFVIIPETFLQGNFSSKDCLFQKKFVFLQRRFNRS